RRPGARPEPLPARRGGVPGRVDRGPGVDAGDEAGARAVPRPDHLGCADPLARGRGRAAVPAANAERQAVAARQRPAALRALRGLRGSRHRALRRRRLRRAAAACLLLGAGAALGVGATFIGRGGGGRPTPAPVTAARPAKPAAPKERPLPGEIRGVHVTMGLASLPGKLYEYLALKDY